jgi:hypothetical protein
VEARIYAYMSLPTGPTIVEFGKKLIGLAKNTSVRALLNNPLQGMPLNRAQGQRVLFEAPSEN